MTKFEQGLEAKSIASFENYNKVLEETRFAHYNEREAARNEAWKALIPRVGLKCTICYYSDYRAATVTQVLSNCKLVVKFNKTKCLDWYAGDYEIYDELDDHMGEVVFTKRRNGYWVEEGQAYKDGVLLMLHYQRHYIDPSF